MILPLKPALRGYCECDQFEIVRNFATLLRVHDAKLGIPVVIYWDAMDFLWEFMALSWDFMDFSWEITGK